MPKRNELLPLSQNTKSRQLTFESTVGILTQFHHDRCISQYFMSIPVASGVCALSCMVFCSSRETKNGVGSGLGFFGKTEVRIQKQFPWLSSFTETCPYFSKKTQQTPLFKQYDCYGSVDLLLKSVPAVKTRMCSLWFPTLLLICMNSRPLSLVTYSTLGNSGNVESISWAAHSQLLDRQQSGKKGKDWRSLSK